MGDLREKGAATREKIKALKVVYENTLAGRNNLIATDFPTVRAEKVKCQSVIIFIMAVGALTAAIACGSYPQDEVAHIEGIQNVSQLVQKYRTAESESPDQLKIFKQSKQQETFHGLITKPIEDSKVQMHLRKEPWIAEDTYAECILHDQNQAFVAKVGEHVTISGRVSDFSRHQITFTECQILKNHTKQTN